MKHVLSHYMHHYNQTGRILDILPASFKAVDKGVLGAPTTFQHPPDFILWQHVCPEEFLPACLKALSLFFTSIHACLSIVMTINETTLTLMLAAGRRRHHTQCRHPSNLEICFWYQTDS